MYGLGNIYKSKFPPISEQRHLSSNSPNLQVHTHTHTHIHTLDEPRKEGKRSVMREPTNGLA